MLVPSLALHVQMTKGHNSACSHGIARPCMHQLCWPRLQQEQEHSAPAQRATAGPSGAAAPVQV